jgi:hypothetical protein
MNYPESYVECPALAEKCRFVEPHLPINSGNPYVSPYARPTLDGIDYEQLPLGRVFLNFYQNFLWNTKNYALLTQSVATVFIPLTEE